MSNAANPPPSHPPLGAITANKAMHIDSPGMRQAGRELLSLALMDARNHSLHLLGQLIDAPNADAAAQMAQDDGLSPALWLLGHVGWFQEWWIARNLQRQRGLACDPLALRLASVNPHSDGLWNPALISMEGRWALRRDLADVKHYLFATLEATLELLEKADEDDASLYFYRLALFHEDQCGEALLVLAQALGVGLKVALPGPVPAREPVLVPATRWKVGAPTRAGGFAFDNEASAFDVTVPEFEIDAQAVSWAQFVEFVDDAGYDRPELWHPKGWDWLQDKASNEGRRGPRYVDQIGVASGAVMQTRFGRAMRMLGNQCATHLTWWEADAYARWAGRRLPAEVEWEVAAHTVIRRGFRWGDVWEWTGTTFNPYPGFEAGPWRGYSQPFFGTHRVLRGASFATRARLKNPLFRGFSLPGSDAQFYGFRTCAL